MHPEAWLPSGSTEIWMDERMANIKTSETQDASALHSVLWVQILPFPLVSYKVLSGRQIGVRNTPWLPVSQLISGVQCSDSSCFHKILRGFVSWPITDFNNFLYIRKHAAPSHLGKVTWERCTMSLPWEESSLSLSAGWQAVFTWTPQYKDLHWSQPPAGALWRTFFREVR